jgi:alpha-N-arabinofuranosidase
MVLTPTYHVYDLFKVHQNAKLISTKLETTDYIFGEKKIPSLNCSASMDDAGKIHLSITNVNLKEAQKISCDLVMYKVKSISGQILTSEQINAYNSFDNPEVVVPRNFSDFKIVNNVLEITMPPKSVVVLELDNKQ